MLATQPALKVTVHLNQDTNSAGGFLCDEVLRFLQRSGVAGATVFRAHAGFGSHHRLHVEGGGPVTGEHLPVLITFIDTEERLRTVLPDLLRMVSDGMVEAHATTILKSANTEPRVVS